MNPATGFLSDGVLVIRALLRYEVNIMDLNLLNDLIYIFGFISIFVSLISITAGIVRLVYLLVPSFRKWFDDYEAGLPEWEEVE